MDIDVITEISKTIEGRKMLSKIIAEPIIRGGIPKNSQPPIKDRITTYIKQYLKDFGFQLKDSTKERMEKDLI